MRRTRPCRSSSAPAMGLMRMPGTRLAKVTMPASAGEWYSLSVNRIMTTLVIDCAMRASDMDRMTRPSCGTASSARYDRSPVTSCVTQGWYGADKTTGLSAHRTAAAILPGNGSLAPSQPARGDDAGPADHLGGLAGRCRRHRHLPLRRLRHRPRRGPQPAWRRRPRQGRAGLPGDPVPLLPAHASR